MMLTDKQFYKACLNLSIPEMAEAKKLYFEGDSAGAAKVFAAYVRRTTNYEKYFTLPRVETSFSEEKSQKILAATPMGRFGEADELLGTLLWLCDAKASGFVNGIVVPVDGGFSAYSGV